MPFQRLSAALLIAVASCGGAAEPTFTNEVALPLGTWGSKGAGLIVSDTAAHLHIGCTFGDVSGRIALDAAGRFDVTGSYRLRAYPITVGPAVPARFVGYLAGSVVHVTVTVNDTVARETVVKGPVDVKFGAEMQLDPCPICRRPVVTRSIFKALASYIRA